MIANLFVVKNSKRQPDPRYHFFDIVNLDDESYRILKSSIDNRFHRDMIEPLTDDHLAFCVDGVAKWLDDSEDRICNLFVYKKDAKSLHNTLQAGFYIRSIINDVKINVLDKGSNKMTLKIGLKRGTKRFQLLFDTYTLMTEEDRGWRQHQVELEYGPGR
jgi:hypothetical protein